MNKTVFSRSPLHEFDIPASVSRSYPERHTAITPEELQIVAREIIALSSWDATEAA